MMTIEPERDLFSIGQLAAHLQHSVRDIELAADRLGLQPACRINLVLHFDGEAVQALTEHLRRAAPGEPI